jgi:hypothetical protein
MPRPARSALALAIVGAVLAGCSSASQSSAASASISASAAAAASAAASAAANTNPSSAQEYASAVCANLATWDLSIESDTGSFKSELQGAGSTDEMKSAIITFLGRTIGRTEQMVDGIGAIDPSGVSGGDEAQSSILAAARTNVAGLRLALEKFQGLDASDETQMISGLLKIQKEMRSSGFNVPLPLRDIDDPELMRAFREATDCASFI